MVLVEEEIQMLKSCPCYGFDLLLQAEYGRSSDTKALKKRHSPSDNFLQVTTSQIDFMVSGINHSFRN